MENNNPDIENQNAQDNTVIEVLNPVSTESEMVLMPAALYNTSVPRKIHAEIQRSDEITMSEHFTDSLTFLQQVNNFLQAHPIINMEVSAVVGAGTMYILEHVGDIFEHTFN